MFIRVGRKWNWSRGRVLGSFTVSRQKPSKSCWQSNGAAASCPTIEPSLAGVEQTSDSTRRSKSKPPPLERGSWRSSFPPPNARLPPSTHFHLPTSGYELRHSFYSLSLPQNLQSLNQIRDSRVTQHHGSHQGGESLPKLNPCLTPPSGSPGHPHERPTTRWNDCNLGVAAPARPTRIIGVSIRGGLAR